MIQAARARSSVRELDPLLVTSPSIRSGTTLLQRLLCSSSNGLVYGEEIGKDLESQLQISASRKLIYSQARPHLSRSLETVLRGEDDGWIADLMPDVDGYLAALHEGAFAGLAFCREHSRSVGRDLWGFKYPGWPPYLLRLLTDHLPRTRVICIVRDLADTARSAKAWGAFENQGDLPAFCGRWLANLQFMREWQREHAVLMLSFETLVNEPDAAIASLRGFAPFRDIDPSLLRHRVNRAAQAADADAYLQPAGLSAEEQACIEATVAAAGPY